MPVPSDRYAEDARRCREILAEGSKSFHAASMFLPSRVRGPASVLYAFCRVADDAVDLAPPGGAHDAIGVLHRRLDGIFGASPADDPIDRALSVVVERFAMPRTPLDALLDGFAWDVEGRRYATMNELHGYCARVAAAVGVMMTVLMGRRAPGVLARACDLGVAMQLTNICRDVGEDARNGRVYLPTEWLAEEGLDADALVSHPRHTPALGRVVERVLVEADRVYARSDAGVAMLPRDCRAAIRAARLLYSAIGTEVRRRGGDSVSGRAVVSTAEKARLLGRALGAPLGRSREPAPDEPPPLLAVRFLVEGW